MYGLSERSFHGFCRVHTKDEEEQNKYTFI